MAEFESLHNHVKSSALKQTENLDPFEGLSIAELKSYLIFIKKPKGFYSELMFFSMCASFTQISFSATVSNLRL